MRKIFTILSLVTLTVANAQYDGFNYETAVAKNGWTTHSGTTEQIVPITSLSDAGKSLSYEDLPASEGNRILLSTSGNEGVNKAFKNDATQAAYASFLIKIVDVSAAPENTSTSSPIGYFFNFSPNSGSSLGSSGLVSRVGVRKGSQSGTFNLSLLNTTGGTIAGTEIFGESPKNYNLNQTYFVVVKYDMTGVSGKSTIWVNTLSENEITHTSSAGSSNKQANISSIAIRQHKAGAGIEIDEVRLGSSWKDVTEATLSTGEVVEKNKVIVSNTFVVDKFKVLSNQKTSVDVYSINGQLVKTVQVAPQNEVNISNLPSGVYILKIVEGNKTYTQKIVKK